LMVRSRVPSYLVPCPGSLPCAAHVCHSKLRQMLYGSRSPWRLRMFRLALTQRSAWAPAPEKVGTIHGLLGSSNLTCWLQYSSIDSSKPRSAGACAYHCIGALTHTGAMVHWCIGALVHWRIGALAHWCIGVLVHCRMARWHASAKAAPPETDPRSPGLPRNQLVSQCRPSSVALKKSTLLCGTPVSVRGEGWA
jgi:hypothetical protein